MALTEDVFRSQRMVGLNLESAGERMLSGEAGQVNKT